MLRVFALVILGILAGCQTSRDHPSNQYMGQYAPSGTFGYGDGSIGVFGKAWGDDGKLVAQKVAYRRLYEFASKNGYTLFYLTSEKFNRVEKGTKTLIPMATKDDDYHSVKMTARVFTGTLGAPRRAQSIDWLRERYEPGFTRSFLPEDNLDDTDLLADLPDETDPVSIIPDEPRVSQSDVSARTGTKLKKVKAEDGPVIIKAPES